jgi:AraC-like DNA-binding protein
MPVLPAFKIFQPPPALADIVDSILEMDFPDAGTARNLMIKVVPVTTPALAIMFRSQAQTDVRWRFGADGFQHNGDKHTATKLHSGVVTLRPKGATGVLIVSLKPEAGTRVFGASLEQFLDTRIELSDVFNRDEVCRLEDGVANARDSAGRIKCVEAFLLRHVRDAQPDPVVSRAVSLVRRVPSLTVRQLASKLEISERHFRRRFQAMTGSSPKHFARIARIEKLLAARRSGATWAETAYACGFQDQAHLIHDFNLIVGQTPDSFLGTASLLPGMECFALFQRDGPPLNGEEAFFRFQRRRPRSSLR